jgi:lipopolysaccharide biosynthesis glycosyltransferase
MKTLRPSSPVSNGRIDVAFACDSAYLQPLAVAIASLLETSRAPSRIHVWLVTRTLDEQALEPIRHVVNDAGAKLTLLSVTREELLRRVPLSEHLTEAAYYRLLLPELLPRSMDRVIYLDADVVVRRPIEHLWSIDLAGTCTGAVLNPRALNVIPMGLSHESDYFNSGVLLIDLARWRDEQIAERALEFAVAFEGNLLCHDQDALNHVLNGHWHRLDLRWNQQFKFFKHPATFLRISAAALRRARSDPFIVHFTSNTKPWHYSNDHPWRGLYYRYLDRTPFRGWRPAPRNFRERLRRSARLLMPHHLRPDVIRSNYRPQLRVLKSLLTVASRER